MRVKYFQVGVDENRIISIPHACTSHGGMMLTTAKTLCMKPLQTKLAGVRVNIYQRNTVKCSPFLLVMASLHLKDIQAIFLGKYSFEKYKHHLCFNFLVHAMCSSNPSIMHV